MVKNTEIYKRIFELGRRIKILNPTLMKGTYGKMMWMLMDARKDEIRSRLGFDAGGEEVRTVYTLLCSNPASHEVVLWGCQFFPRLGVSVYDFSKESEYFLGQRIFSQWGSRHFSPSARKSKICHMRGDACCDFSKTFGLFHFKLQIPP